MKIPAFAAGCAMSLLVAACTSLSTVRGDLEFAGNDATATLESLLGEWTVASTHGQRTLEFDRLALVRDSPYLLGHDESELPILVRFNADRRRLEVRGSEFFSETNDEAAAVDAIPSTIRSGSPLLPLLTGNYFDVTSIEGASISGVEIRDGGHMGEVRVEVARASQPHPSLVELSDSVAVYDDCVASVVVDPASLERLQRNRARIQLADLGFLSDFYRQFGDAFDFIALVPDALAVVPGAGIAGGQFIPVQTLERGVGKPYDSRGGRLQGVIFLPDNRGLAVEPILHELAHNWANSFTEISANGHWGNSNVNGVLGGNDIAGEPAPDGVASNTTPFAPLELYLMGLVDGSGVPDVRLADGTDIPITDLIRKYGERDPGVQVSQKQFRMAVVLFGAARPDELVLHRNCQDARWFSLDRDDGHPGLYNFWKATGGRARMVADRLLDARLDSPSP